MIVQNPPIILPDDSGRLPMLSGVMLDSSPVYRLTRSLRDIR